MWPWDWHWHHILSVSVLGTVGQWMSGLGTIVALFGLFRLVRKDRRDAFADHATQLACWIKGARDKPLEIEVFLRNGSGSPFSAVSVQYQFMNGLRKRADFVATTIHAKGSPPGFVPPGDKVYEFLPDPNSLDENCVLLDSVLLEYRDRRGTEWRQVIEHGYVHFYYQKDRGLPRALIGLLVYLATKNLAPTRKRAYAWSDWLMEGKYKYLKR